MTAIPPPPDRAKTLRAALRKHAGTWIRRFYRHEILVARTVRGYEDDAEALFRRDVVMPVVQRVAGGLATFDRRGNDIVAEADPQLRGILFDVQQIVRRGVAAVRSRADGNLHDLVDHETKWLKDSATKVLKVDAPAVDASTVSGLVQRRPYLGGRVEEWFDSLIGGDNGAADNVRYAIQEGIARGWTEAEIVRTLRGKRETGYTDGLLTQQNVSQVRSLVRSAASHASAVTRFETFKALGVTQWRWLATLDLKTCIVCATNEQNSPYPMGEGPTFPAHPGDRCTCVPWFGEPIGTRASADGQVPATMTVPEWWEGRSVAEQDEVVGKTRAQAWRSGRLPFNRMLGADLKPLTIAELRRMDLIPDEDE